MARSAIDLRLALREGRPISRARLLFSRAIRVDSPTSPAVACSVRRQLSLHVSRRAPRYESERTALRGHRVVAALALVFEAATSAPLRVATHHGHPSVTHAFADATMRRRRVRCPPSDSVDGHDGAADAAASCEGGGCALGRVIGGPERLLGRAHIAHLFYPSQYSPTSPAYSCGPGVLTQSSASGRVPHRSFSTQAYVTRVQCRPGVWNQPTTSG